MKVIGLIILGFVLGSCMTAMHVSGQSTKTEFVRIPGKTKVIYEEKEGPTKYVFPDSCLRAVELADVIVRNSEDMYDYGTEQLNIISDARMFLADNRDLAVIENRQRDLQGKMVGNLADAEEAFNEYQTAEPKCKEEMK